MGLKPICVKCQRFYRPKKNGIFLTEGMPIGDRVPPGTTHSELWEPYKIWSGDLWECQGCNHQIVVGTGAGPVSIHHQADFSSFQKLSHLQVNDC